MGGSFTPDLMRYLREAGCYFLRNGKGDHQVWHSPITDRSFTVDSKIVSRHTANATLKQAGLAKLF